MLRVKLRELLQSHNTSINELSERTGIGRRPLTQLANNESKMVKFDTLDKIKNYFQLKNLSDLFVDEELSEIFFSLQPMENNVLRSGVTVDVQQFREGTPIFESFLIDLTLYQNTNSDYTLTGGIEDRFKDMDVAVTNVFKKLHPLQIEQFIHNFGDELLSYPYTTDSTPAFKHGLFPDELIKHFFTVKACLHVSIPELNIAGDLSFSNIESHFDTQETDSDNPVVHEWFLASINSSPDYYSVFPNLELEGFPISLSIVPYELQ